MKHFVVFFPVMVLTTILSSCSGMKAYKLMQAGEVAQKQFSEELAFEYRLGVIVIPVEIRQKTYHFLLDTGAPNVISTELAAELGLEAAFTMKTTDSQKNHSQLEYVVLDTVRIGGLDFIQTTAAVADLQQSNEVKCLKIDGLIGANLMRKAIWTVDYEQQRISITDSTHAINLDNTVGIVHFEPTITGTPKISVQLNGVSIEHITADTGSNGELSLDESAYKKLKHSHPDLPEVSGYGNNSSGIYGAGDQDSTKLVLVPDVQAGNLHIDSACVGFQSGGSSTFGTRYFRRYRVTFNWLNNTITFDQPRPDMAQPRKSFGFDYFYRSGGLYVNLIYNDSKAQQDGLQIGDHILEINGEDYAIVDNERWCELIDHDPIKEAKQIHLVVERNGKSYTFDLQNEPLIPIK